MQYYTVVRELESKIELGTLTKYALQSAEQRLEKIKLSMIIGNRDLDFIEENFGTEVVITKEGYVDFYIVGRERYASKIHYYKVGNWQYTFGLGDMYFASGKQAKEYKTLGGLINGLNKYYSEYGYEFIANAKELNKLAKEEFEIQQELEYKENLSAVEKEALEVSNLVDAFEESLENISNIDDALVVVNEILISEESQQENLHYTIGKYFDTSYTLGRLLTNHTEKIITNLSIKTELNDMEKDFVKRIVNRDSRDFSEISMSENTKTLIEVLLFRLTGEVPAYEEFLENEIVPDLDFIPVINKEKIEAFRLANIGVEIVGEEVVMYDVTEQLEGQRDLIEYVACIEKTKKEEEKEMNTVNEEVKKYVTHILEVAKDFNWTIKTIMLLDDNCLGATIEDKEGTIKNEGLYAGADRCNESEEIATILGQMLDVQILDMKGIDIFEVEVPDVKMKKMNGEYTTVALEKGTIVKIKNDIYVNDKRIQESFAIGKIVGVSIDMIGKYAVDIDGDYKCIYNSDIIEYEVFDAPEVEIKNNTNNELLTELMQDVIKKTKVESVFNKEITIFDYDLTRLYIDNFREDDITLRMWSVRETKGKKQDKVEFQWTLFQELEGETSSKEISVGTTVITIDKEPEKNKKENNKMNTINKSQLNKNMKLLGKELLDIYKIKDKTKQLEEYEKVVKDIFPDSCEFNMEDAFMDEGIGFLVGQEYIGAKPSKKIMTEEDANFEKIISTSSLCIWAYVTKWNVKLIATVYVKYMDYSKYENSMDVAISEMDFDINLTDEEMETEILKITSDCALGSISIKKAIEEYEDLKFRTENKEIKKQINDSICSCYSFRDKENREKEIQCVRAKLDNIRRCYEQKETVTVEKCVEKIEKHMASYLEDEQILHMIVCELDFYKSELKIDEIDIQKKNIDINVTILEKQIKSTIELTGVIDSESAKSLLSQITDKQVVIFDNEYGYKISGATNEKYLGEVNERCADDLVDIEEVQNICYTMKYDRKMNKLIILVEYGLEYVDCWGTVEATMVDIFHKEITVPEVDMLEECDDFNIEIENNDIEIEKINVINIEKQIICPECKEIVDITGFGSAITELVSDNLSPQYYCKKCKTMTVGECIKINLVEMKQEAIPVPEEKIETNKCEVEPKEEIIENKYEIEPEEKINNVVNDFLDNWVISAKKFYKEVYEYDRETYTNKETLFPKKEYECRGKMYMSSPYADYQSHMIYKYGKGVYLTIKEKYHQIDEVIQKERERKYKKLISDMKNKAGNIIDAKGLFIGENLDINGIIIGDKGIFNINTIYAGGHSVQCLHFRVLIKERKIKEQG